MSNATCLQRSETYIHTTQYLDWPSRTTGTAETPSARDLEPEPDWFCLFPPSVSFGHSRFGVVGQHYSRHLNGQLKREKKTKYYPLDAHEAVTLEVAAEATFNRGGGVSCILCSYHFQPAFRRQNIPPKELLSTPGTSADVAERFNARNICAASEIDPNPKPRSAVVFARSGRS